MNLYVREIYINMMTKGDRMGLGQTHYLLKHLESQLEYVRLHGPKIYEVEDEL